MRLRKHALSNYLVGMKSGQLIANQIWEFCYSPVKITVLFICSMFYFPLLVQTYITFGLHLVRVLLGLSLGPVSHVHNLACLCRYSFGYGVIPRQTLGVLQVSFTEKQSLYAG